MTSFERLLLVIALFVLALLASQLAHAQGKPPPLIITETAPASISLDLGPTLQIVFSYLVPIILTLIGGAVTYAAKQVQAHTGFQVDAADLDKFKSAAKGEAAKLILASESNLAGRSFTVKSPEIVSAVSAVQSQVPDILNKLGITPDAVANKIAGYLGEMQSNAAVIGASHSDGQVGVNMTPPPDKALS